MKLGAFILPTAEMSVVWVEIQVIISEIKIPPGQELRQGYVGCFLRCIGPRPLPRRAYCEEIKVHRNPPSAQGFSEERTPKKIDTKQLVFSAQQRACTSVAGGQIVPCQAQCDGCGTSAIFPELVTPCLSSVSETKIDPKGHDSRAPRKSLEKRRERW
jgi:hypothetical protein